MPRHCQTIRAGDFVAIVCTRAGRPPRCECGKRSTKQCDFPVGKRGRTCSRHICDTCTFTLGNVSRLEAISAEDIAADPMVAFAIERGLMPRREVVDDTVDFCPRHRRQLEEERADRERTKGSGPAPVASAEAPNAHEQLGLDLGGC